MLVQFVSPTDGQMVPVALWFDLNLVKQVISHLLFNNISTFQFMKNDSSAFFSQNFSTYAKHLDILGKVQGTLETTYSI